jgi:hypothetical protein
MAVGDQWTHPQFLGEGKGLAVVGFSPRALRGTAMYRNLTEEAQGIRLVPSRLEGTGELQCLLGEDLRVLQMAGQHLRLPQGETTFRLRSWPGCCNGPFQCLREQRHGVGNVPAERIRRPQGRSHRVEPDREVCVLTDTEGPFELGEGPAQVTLA